MINKLPAAHSAGAVGVVQMTRDPTDILAWRFAPAVSEEPLLHASECLIDALNYAESSILHRFRLSGMIVRGGDTCAATEMTSLWSMNCSDILRTFARQCAFDAIRVSGWSAPLVIIEYLTTGNEKLRSAARAAAGDAAKAAARGGRVASRVGCHEGCRVGGRVGDRVECRMGCRMGGYEG